MLAKGKGQRLLEFGFCEMLGTVIRIRGLCVLVVFCEPRLQGFVSVNLIVMQFNAVQEEIGQRFTLHIKHT